MRRRPSALEQSRNAENERAGANGGDVLCAAGLPADEVDGFSIADRSDHAAHPAGNTNQIKRRTVRESVRGQKTKSTIAGHGSFRFGNDVGRRLRQFGKDLQWAGKIELRKVGENDETHLEVRHT
jgi:hypothetical protein